MSVDEIDAILAERLQCKFRRDFQRADALQEELFSTGLRENQISAVATPLPYLRRLDGVELPRHRRDVVPVNRRFTEVSTHRHGRARARRLEVVAG